MDVTRALSMAQKALKDYDVEGSCLSLYHGSDFINVVTRPQPNIPLKLIKNQNMKVSVIAVMNVLIGQSERNILRHM